MSRVGFYAILIGATALSVFPFAFSVLMSLREPSALFAPGIVPEAPTVQNYLAVFRATPLFARWLANSGLVSLVTVAGVVLLSLMGGYAFARLRFPGRAPLFLLMLGAMMVPGQVLWMPNYATLAWLGWVNTYWALIPGFLGTLTAGIFLASQFLRSVPRELEEAAWLDGLGPYATFAYVILPLTGPLIASLAITAFLASWNAFAWPVIVLNSPELFTLPIGLSFFKGVYITNWALIMAGSVVTTVPVVLVFLLMQRYIIQGIAVQGLKE